MEDICPICRDTLGDIKTSITICKHIYHEKCIKMWNAYGRRQTCPMCRTLLSFKPIIKKKYNTTFIYYIILFLLTLYLFNFIEIFYVINDNGICQWDAKQWCSDRGYIWFKSENHGSLCNTDYCYSLY
jgi:hypothetical protein